MMLVEIWRQPIDTALRARGLNFNGAIKRTSHTLSPPAAQVASTCPQSHNLARARHFETFGRGFVSLDLWHLQLTSQSLNCSFPRLGLATPPRLRCTLANSWDPQA